MSVVRGAPRRARPGRGRARHLALAALLLGACGSGEPAPWSALTGGQRASGGELPPMLRREPGGDAVWVDYALPAEQWRPHPETGGWRTLRPDGLSFLKAGEELALATPTRRFALDPEIHDATRLADLVPGRFAAAGSRLYLCLAPGEPVPEGLVFSVRKQRGVQDGRPVLGGFTGEGFALWPGERMRFRAAVGSGRALRFHWSVEGLLGAREAAARLRVHQDGVLVAELECAAGVQGSGRWCELPLAAARASELEFELAGEPALALVLAPRLGPAEPAPRDERAPNLILFLADTLRADALGALGGPPGSTPALDALARASLSFTTARAPSTWTLPSQASMLSGLWPEQHGATERDLGLAAEIETLPERLAAQGWRTGAVTDSAFVSRQFGFDQGFEYFQEFKRWNLGATLEAARAFLEADDGRPTFLFVQTYRTHMPYRTGPDEDRGPLRKMVREFRATCAAYGGDGSLSEEEASARLLGLYREGVRALDQAFGAWWPGVQALAPTYLVFTSDHGEAFFEHGSVGHGGAPMEVKTRVPLLIHGPGIAAREVAESASLVDLPRTLATLAGVAPAPSFLGEDLLALARARPSYVFVHNEQDGLVAVVEGTRKVIAAANPERLAAGEIRGGTDLARDPGEKVDLAASEGWGQELARAHAAALAELLRPRVAARRVELSEEDRTFLNDLGYGGE
ncbi:MAG TPA: sulfatase [Planctomycetota bacterium]